MEKIEPLFGDVPKPKRRTGVYKTSLARLEEQVKQLPPVTYIATDDDLPIELWKEPDFD